MEAASNPGIVPLAEALFVEMRESGFGTYCLTCTARYAKHLSDFMDREGLQVYDEVAGSAFLEDFCQTHHGITHQRIKLFIARINAIQKGAGFIAHRKLAVPAVLPVKLEILLERYRQYCVDKGNCMATIQRNEYCCRRFLKLLADGGICDNSGITSSTVSAAILCVTSTRALLVIRAFLHFLAEAKYISRDYSFLVPYVRPPQPLPSVYSVEEIQRIEAQVRNDAINGITSIGKRNYAMLLMATRLGLRPCDIVSLTFSELDFQAETIKIIQEKTDTLLELPMLPVIRDALQDYIRNARGHHSSQYVFLSMQPPYCHVSPAVLSCGVHKAISAAGIDRNGRGVCARVLRSSLASSMVNDGVPYEVARRTLGHRDKDAIRHYAKLDVEQLKLYALEPPAATGCFAEVLSGRCSVK